MTENVGVNTCVQKGSNPAVLNEPGGHDEYTVCGGMSTAEAEEWGDDGDV